MKNIKQLDYTQKISLLSLILLLNLASLYAFDNEVSFITKKSLCNTFSGCGRKRSALSVNQQPQKINLEPTIERSLSLQNQHQQQQQQLFNSNKDPSKLVSEVLVELLEYLKASQHAPAKYSVLVPRKYVDTTSKNLPSHDLSGSFASADLLPLWPIVDNQQQQDYE